MSRLAGASGNRQFLTAALLFVTFMAMGRTATAQAEFNTDRPGMDYRNFEMALYSDWRSCKQKCDQDPACKAWTYVKKTAREEARCWLKNGIPRKIQSTCCISGVKSFAQMKIPLMKTITVTSPLGGSICGVGYNCPIKWNREAIKNYPTVILQLIHPDGSSAAGSYTVPNTGEYDWKPDSSWLDQAVYCKEFRWKVFTPDRKVTGTSGLFKVGKFLNSGCP